MTNLNNKVVWSEGMLLRPQQFQQQERYLESLIHFRNSHSCNHNYGFSELTLDLNYLSTHQLGLQACQAIMPDGTIVDCPRTADTPNLLAVPEETNDTIVYLGIPIEKPFSPSIGTQQDNDNHQQHKYQANNLQLHDNTSNDNSLVDIYIARLQPQLLLASDDRSQYITLPIAKIKSCNSEGIVLDEEFIAPTLSLAAIPALTSIANEIYALVENRRQRILTRINIPSRGNAADITDTLLLQLLNRYVSSITHLTQQTQTHPERLYIVALELLAELSTYTADDKHLSTWPAYQHQDLTQSFRSILQQLRVALGTILTERAIALPLSHQNNGIQVAAINDHLNANSIDLVLAVKADIAIGELHSKFPTQTKIATLADIEAIISAQLHGVNVNLLSVAPPQIPYHTGYSYFQIALTPEQARQVQQEKNIAIHVGGNFPNLELELWALRR